jgi:hypothetical protein
VAFNILVFPRIPSDNFNAQVHCHAPPKALCQFNIMRVTCQSDSVRRSAQVGSFSFYFWLVVSLGPLSTLLKKKWSERPHHARHTPVKSMCQSDNRPSGLIFLYVFLALVGLGPLLALLKKKWFERPHHARHVLVRFGAPI